MKNNKLGRTQNHRPMQYSKYSSEDIRESILNITLEQHLYTPITTFGTVGLASFFAAVAIITVVIVESISPFSMTLGERNINDRTGEAQTGNSR